MKEPFINGTYNGNAANYDIQSAIQKANATTQIVIVAYNDGKEGRITATAVMRRRNITSSSTFYRVVRRYEMEIKDYTKK